MVVGKIYLRTREAHMTMMKGNFQTICNLQWFVAVDPVSMERPVILVVTV